MFDSCIWVIRNTCSTLLFLYFIYVLPFTKQQPEALTPWPYYQILYTNFSSRILINYIINNFLLLYPVKFTSTIITQQFIIINIIFLSIRSCIIIISIMFLESSRYYTLSMDSNRPCLNLFLSYTNCNCADQVTGGFR